MDMLMAGRQAGGVPTANESDAQSVLSFLGFPKDGSAIVPDAASLGLGLTLSRGSTDAGSVSLNSTAPAPADVSFDMSTAMHVLSNTPLSNRSSAPELGTGNKYLSESNLGVLKSGSETQNSKGTSKSPSSAKLSPSASGTVNATRSSAEFNAATSFVKASAGPLPESVYDSKHNSARKPFSDEVRVADSKSIENESLSQTKAAALHDCEAVIAEDAVECTTIQIAQVRHTKTSLAQCISGRLISATKHCVAYVLSGRKIRLVAQDNAAVGLMESHSMTMLPVVDVCWRLQDEDLSADSTSVPPVLQSSGLLRTPGTPAGLLASLALGGEICIGNVYADSSTTLAYDALTRFSAPQIAPARGLVWSSVDVSSRPAMLAAYGSSNEVVVLGATSPSGSPGGPLSVGPFVRLAAFALESSGGIDAAYFAGGSYLLLASAGEVHIVPLSNAIRVRQLSEDADNAVPGTIRVHVADDSKRMWLLRYGKKTAGQGREVVLAVSLTSSFELVIKPLLFERNPVIGPGADDTAYVPDSPDYPSEIVPCLDEEVWADGVDLSNDDDTGASSVFVVFDNSSCTLLVGCLSSSDITCIGLSKLDDPKMAIGTWANDSGSLSVSSADHSVVVQRKRLASSSSSDTAYDLVLLAYHTGSVEIHQMRVKWDGEETVEENDTQPVIQSNTVPSVPSAQAVRQSVSQPMDKNASVLMEKKAATNAMADQSIKQSAQISKAFGVRADEQDRALASRLDSIVPEIASRVAVHLRPEAVVAAAVRDQVLPGLRAAVFEAVGDHLAASVSRSIVAASLEGYAAVAAEISSLRASLSEVDAMRKTILDLEQRVQQLQLLCGAMSAEISRSVQSGVESGVRACLQPILENMPSNEALAAMLSRETERMVPAIADAVRRESASHSGEVSRESARSPVQETLRNARLLVMRGEPMRALLHVLETGEPGALNWLLQQLDPASTFDSPESSALLSLPVALALAQQLSHDLELNPALKIAWLTELFTVFDGVVAGAQRDPGQTQYLSSVSDVLDRVFANLRILFAKTPATAGHYGALKTLMRLVRMAMDSV